MLLSGHGLAKCRSGSVGYDLFRLSLRGQFKAKLLLRGSFATRAANAASKASPPKHNNVLTPNSRKNFGGRTVKPSDRYGSPAQHPQTNSSAPPAAGKGYQPQILVYHAGTGRTIFLSCFKLTAVFIFIYGAALIAPAYYYSPTEPDWKAGVALIGGAIPLLAMVFSTAPFVTYVHLALPLWARASQGRLVRYAEHLPSTAVLDITSLRWIWPRVTRLHASELYIHQNKLGAMTIRREIPQEVKDARQWWHWRPLKQFYVAGKSHKTTENGIWEMVVAAIAKNKGPNTRLPVSERRT